MSIAAQRGRLLDRHDPTLEPDDQQDAKGRPVLNGFAHIGALRAVLPLMRVDVNGGSWIRCLFGPRLLSLVGRLPRE